MTTAHEIQAMQLQWRENCSAIAKGITDAVKDGAPVQLTAHAANIIAGALRQAEPPGQHAAALAQGYAAGVCERGTTSKLAWAAYRLESLGWYWHENDWQKIGGNHIADSERAARALLLKAGYTWHGDGAWLAPGQQPPRQIGGV